MNYHQSWQEVRQQRCLQKFRLYGMSQEIGSTQHEWSDASRPYLCATENVLVSDLVTGTGTWLSSKQRSSTL